MKATELQAIVRVQFKNGGHIHDLHATQRKTRGTFRLQKHGDNILFFQQLEELGITVTNISLNLEGDKWSHSICKVSKFILEDHAALSFVNKPCLPPHRLSKKSLYDDDDDDDDVVEMEADELLRIGLQWLDEEELLNQSIKVFEPPVAKAMELDDDVEDLVRAGLEFINEEEMEEEVEEEEEEDEEIEQEAKAIELDEEMEEIEKVEEMERILPINKKAKAMKVYVPSAAKLAARAASKIWLERESRYHAAKQAIRSVEQDRLMEADKRAMMEDMAKKRS